MKGHRGLCHAFGMTIASEIDIPGSIGLAAKEAVADIVVDVGRVPDWKESAAWGPYRVASADLFEFTMPGVAIFTCRDRCRVTITPTPDAPLEAISAMLIATALPSLLWARGEIVIHAAAGASIGSARGFLVAGRSGSGKSTRLFRGLRRGLRIIGDDSVRLRLVDGVVMASGLPGCIIERRGPDIGGQIAHRVPEPNAMREYPVDTIYLLERTEEFDEAAGTLRTVTALLRHRHRARIARMLALDQTALQKIASLARGLEAIRLDPECRIHPESRIDFSSSDARSASSTGE